jgi:hypothetical protein
LISGATSRDVGIAAVLRMEHLPHKAPPSDRHGPAGELPAVFPALTASMLPRVSPGRFVLSRVMSMGPNCQRPAKTPYWRQVRVPLAPRLTCGFRAENGLSIRCQ